MQRLSVCLLAVLVPSAAAQARARQDNQQLIAALERMAATGEPHHNTHGEGEVLQRAVDAALQRYDRAVERAAIRAAAQIAMRVVRPVMTVDAVSAEVSARLALTFPRPVTFAARIFASFDGGAIVALGDVRPGGTNHLTLPDIGRWPGAHHVRLRAYIVYEGETEGGLPDPELRDLPELAYAVYDPRLPPMNDARVFQFSPATVSATVLDRALPDVPFWFWLDTLLVEHGSDPLHEFQWRSFFCDERTKEPYAPTRRHDICAVVLFGVGTAAGEIWIRTGRIDYSETGAVRWFASPPVFEALRFVSPESSEVTELGRLAELLATGPDRWPAPDVSVSGADIAITPVAGKPNTVLVRATLRNVGEMDARNVYVQLMGGDPDGVLASGHFIVDVPARGTAEIEFRMHCARGYGIAFVAAFTPLTEYSPVMSGRDDPTPANNVAYRVINPERAPKALLAQWQAHFCTITGGKCGGH